MLEPKAPYCFQTSRVLIHSHKPHFQYSLALVNDFTYSSVLVFQLDSVEVQLQVNRPEVGVPRRLRKQEGHIGGKHEVSELPACELGTLTVFHLEYLFFRNNQPRKKGR